MGQSQVESDNSGNRRLSLGQLQTQTPENQVLKSKNVVEKPFEGDHSEHNNSINKTSLVD